MNYVIALIGIAILAYDNWLSYEGRMTISQRVQELAPPVIDWVIGIGGWIGLCILKHYRPEFDFTLGVFIAGFWGHMWIANKERYGR